MPYINFSDPMTIAILSVVVLAIVLAIAAIVHKRNTKARLRSRFGSEYDRAVLEHGSERKAQIALAERETRVRQLKLRELGTAQRERFSTDWNTVQSRFVDHPKGALIEADELVYALLQARGYPVSGFDQSAEDISVDYPRMIESYRSSHSVAVQAARGEASTEDLRTAMIQYRNLFDELMKAGAPAESRTMPVRPITTHSVR